MSRIAFVSTYPPRRCGVALFTADLASAVGAAEVVSLRRSDEPHHAGTGVHHTIRTDVHADHVLVARALAGCDVDIVSVQFEESLWGEPDGSSILAFLDELMMPAIATIHTVLDAPTPAQQAVMKGIEAQTVAMVVMSQAAAEQLERRYHVDPKRIEVIPHGAPTLPFVDADSIKPAVGLEGRHVLLSFGLLGPGKGYEAVLRALPAVVEAVPDVCYVILGATHPELLLREGERYRQSLEALTAELGLTGAVRFVDRFVGRLELGRWLEAADVFVAPSPDLDTIGSGTLSCAMAAGTPTVASPSRFAAELLADGRGRLVDPAATAHLSEALVDLLLDDDVRLAMGRLAYDHGRDMVWPKVAARYQALFARHLRPTTNHPSRGLAVRGI